MQLAIMQLIHQIKLLQLIQVSLRSLKIWEFFCYIQRETNKSFGWALLGVAIFSWRRKTSFFDAGCQRTKHLSFSFPISGDVVGLGIDGKPISIGNFAYDKISISPDNSWLLMYNETNLYLYDTNDHLAQTFAIPEIYNVIWRPDSQQYFFQMAKRYIFFLSRMESQDLIDECEQSSCSLDDVVWLP